jgi:hypothetical protein
MIDFAHHDWRRDPPPPRPALAPDAIAARPRRPWVSIGVASAVAALSFIAVTYGIALKPRGKYPLIMENPYQERARVQFLTRIPIGTVQATAWKELRDLGASCRPVATASDMPIDVCLADVIDYGTRVFTQMAFRLLWQRGRLAAVEACPTIVHAGARPVVDTMPTHATVRDSRDLTCWRTADDIVTARLMSTTLPDRPTVMRHIPAVASDSSYLHYRGDLKTMPPVRDTVWVIW